MRIKVFFSYLLILGAYQWSTGQTFPCDGRMFVFLNQGKKPTFAHWIDYQSIENVFFNTFTTFADAAFDAVGFNSQDNFIYAVLSNSNKIVRLKSDGSFEEIGTVPQVQKLDAFAGDCSPNGQFVFYENNLKQLLYFDVINEFSQVRSLDLFWDPGSPNRGAFTTVIDDLAFDPTNPTVAYTYHGNYNRPETEPPFTRGHLLKINLDFNDSNVGMVSPVGPIDKGLVSQMGSLFFTNDGQLFGYGSGNSWPNFNQNRFIQIDKNSGLSTLIRSGPGAAIGDGCSCPYNLTFQKDADPRIIPCSNSEVIFDFTIINRFKEDLMDLLLKDTLPEGVIIQSISGNFKGRITPETGVGTRFLTITGLEAPQNEIVSIRLETKLNNIPLGLASSQAYLRKLPIQLGELFASDDPQTDGVFSDPTLIYGTPPTLKNIEISTIQPSDCLYPNNGKAQISSPQIIAGQIYNIEFINDKWESFNCAIMADNQQSISIDSLPPGEYTLKRIFFKGSDCGFSFENNTFQISLPNHLLFLDATSNSPICIGEDLHLEGTALSESEVLWTGPNGFASSELQPSIFSTDVAHNGTYTFRTTYGECTQEKSIEVMVLPRTNAQILGTEPICEGQSLKFIANGKISQNSYQWAGPNGWKADSQTVHISSVSLQNNGDYQVIINNGACSDTANTALVVYPKPKIKLPATITTELCDPYILTPTVTGGNKLIYKWEPTDGLNCLDCASPRVILPFDPSYNLLVSNEWGCQDSAEVQIVIDNEKLLYAPNAFSPNNDGINDYFELFPGCGVLEIKGLLIFDRWGNQVFEVGILDYQNQLQLWDGSVNGENAAPGSYLWRTEIELIDGTLKQLSGNVMILR